jgi:phosphonatase-like hydrolase
MPVRLIVLDIAGTTVCDNNEVLNCFSAACRESGITASDARLNALMGVSKLEVFHTLWREQSGEGASDDMIAEKADGTYAIFRHILEDYYRACPLHPTEGALELFHWARGMNINIALNTGFYRAVTDIILGRMGWLPGMSGSPVQFAITSEEVPAGRPAPHMIHAAMAYFGVENPKDVVKIGDTPVDLLEGRNAGCLMSLAVTNGTHTFEQLSVFDNDGLLKSLRYLPEFLFT